MNESAATTMWLLAEAAEPAAAPWRAMPVMIVVLCVLAIAYRYYSAFLAAKVAALDGNRVTPAHTLNDGQNYHPTNKWVLFGHHFAAISGAGPLIGPVLAIQFGFLPGLIWIVVGVCLAGAVQDMLVLAASVRHNGRSLAEIAREQVGQFAGGLVGVTILFIVVIALAGLGIVVVKALGGEEAKYPRGAVLTVPTDGAPVEELSRGPRVELRLPRGCTLTAPSGDAKTYPETFRIAVPEKAADAFVAAVETGKAVIPDDTRRIIAGSSWGTFTIAATIPIALFVGWYMYRLRPGAVLEASLIGGALTIGATWLGAFIPGSQLEPFFELSKQQITIAMAIYGFVASVLPVWLLLGPRDYLSSFLKIGTIAFLVIGVLVANPVLEAPAFNPVFSEKGGPTFPQGGIFPFVFICIMCGAVSGFHSLVSSGTTPKMVGDERHVRPVGYGAMLIEGLVGITALIAAASLPSRDYYDINIDLDKAPAYEQQVQRVIALGERGRQASHRPLSELETEVGEELRGRTGGAVTLAVGIANIFDQAMPFFRGLLKYWYHFAIMFEALFILTTIDAGTRIARFLLQENLGKIYKPFAQPDWLPGSIIATGLVTFGWGWLIYNGSISTIWPMFGIANQLLAVIALATVTTWLCNTGRRQYMWVTLLPMMFVISTTMTAGVQLVFGENPGNFSTMIAAGREKNDPALVFQGYLNATVTLLLMASVLTVLGFAAAKWIRPAPPIEPKADAAV
jgi:carbon starvation protein